VSPTISGPAQQGETLRLRHGAWSNGPTRYADTWMDCDGAGGHCTAISRATSQTYTLVARDVGRTIRVRESATNAGGTAGPVTSPRTARIAAARCVVPGLRHLTLSQARRALGRAHCQLGTLRKPRGVAPHHVLRVVSQSAPARSRHANDYRVDVRLG
jgi:hypothetical protein